LKTLISRGLRWFVEAGAIVCLALVSRHAIAAVGTSIPGADTITDAVTDGATTLKTALKLIVGAAGLIILAKGCLDAAHKINDSREGGNAVWLIIKLVVSAVMIGIALTAIG
jgi:hypothetical protein